jgi:penicillin-binding protein 1A
MSIRNALAQSINIPAIKMLYLVGVKDAIKTARDMGIKSLTDPSRYGLTLVIGGGEVSLLDMTNAYATFANNGIYNPATGILKVEDAKGTVLMDFTERSTQAIPSNVALTISDVLSDNTARTPTFGSNSPLVVPGYDVAAKTGTTNNNKDAWTMGYSPELAVGVWVGNNDNTPMKKGGAALAGPIWNQFMRLSLPKFNNTSFEAPAPIETGDKPVFRGIWQGGRSFIIDTVSGKLATEFTPKETRKEIAITDVHDILYWVDKDNPRGAAPANPEKDSQFINWETAVRKWWSISRK